MLLPADVLTHAVSFLVGPLYWTRERRALCCASRLLRATYEAVSERRTAVTVTRMLPARLPPALHALMVVISAALKPGEYHQNARFPRLVDVGWSSMPATLRMLCVANLELVDTDITEFAKLSGLQYLHLDHCSFAIHDSPNNDSFVQHVLRPLIGIRHLIVIAHRTMRLFDDRPHETHAPVRGDTLETTYCSPFGFLTEGISYRVVRYITRGVYTPYDIEQMRALCGADEFTIVKP